MESSFEERQMEDADDIRDVRLMLQSSRKYPEAVWREAVTDLLREIDRLQGRCRRPGSGVEDGA